MDARLQHQIAFYLTGRRGTDLAPLDGSFRPALLARYRDLSELRYDFPLVLNRGATPDRTVLSLSRLVDDAIAAMPEGVERDRVARHGHRVESQLRRELNASGPGDFATMWHTAADTAAGEDDSVRESAMRLWKAFSADGDLLDADRALPARVVRAAWNAVQGKKSADFRSRAERLLHKLRDILAAEANDSVAGRAPERLRAGVGSSFAGAFDFDALSRILVESKPGIRLSDTRRERIRGLIDVLERQRFFPLGNGAPAPYEFFFEHCADAIRAYNERRSDAVALIKSLAVAELEAVGDYRESVHDVLFADFGANGLDVGELGQLPDYLVCIDGRTIDAAETSEIVELLAAGLPFNVLVQTDDVLESSAVAEGHVALGLRARQLVNTAIGLTDVFVLQAGASGLFGARESLLRGLSYDGPALFSVFSGVNDHTGDVPSYLIAAAATESRVFPSIVYDPSAGSDWASRLSVAGNPSVGDDWPVHRFTYEDRELQSVNEDLAFTAADFMMLDDRFSGHFAVAAIDGQQDSLIPVPEALTAGTLSEKVPSVALVDADNRLRRAILDDRLLLETRRCRAMWHSLQELAGIHNSHAERLLAEELRKREKPVEEPRSEPVGGAPAPVLVEAQEPSAPASDDPYIETSRCTSCNECTHVNAKMFVYNENKQAYIADPDAGTFRQLVEAAEGCQVGIIHPGKPRNPKEPGLDDLLVRAEPFL